MSEFRTDSDMAARWLIRMDEPKWTERHQHAFDRWLGASASRRAVFWRLEQGWRAADRIASLNTPAAMVAPRGVRWRPRIVRSLKIGLVPLGAVAAAVALLVFHPGLTTEAPAPGRRYVTAANGHRSVETQDGSRIDMAADTRMTTRVASRDRDVFLDEGEAFFDVRHARDRPFRVHAGDNLVTVLGTRFSVRYVGGELRVVVFSGLVQIAHNEGPGKTSGLIVLPKNKMATISGSSAAIEQVPGSATPLVTFEDEQLSAVIHRFPALAGKTVIFSNDAAAGIRVSGSFMADNDDGFVRLLERAYGLEVTRSGQHVTIGTRNDGHADLPDRPGSPPQPIRRTTGASPR